jgi:hypothetical protein
VKQSGKVCAKCRTKFYKMRKTCDSYESPRADANELQKVEQEEHDSSHKAEDASASNAATEILNSSLQAVGKSPIKKKQLQKKKKKYPKKRIQKITKAVKKNITHVSK